MINYVRKGEIVHFIQVYDEKRNKQPKIECYSLYDFIRIPEDKGEVGFGKLSITADNVVHLWGGNLNKKHLEKYKELKKGNLLKIVIN